mgnify:CR=1 FL=1
MTKLEGLLREADDRRVRLETRVAEAQRLEWALRQRIEELERRLRDLGQTMPVPPAPAPAQAAEVRRTDGDEFAAVLHQSMLREQARTSAQPALPLQRAAIPHRDAHPAVSQFSAPPMVERAAAFAGRMPAVPAAEEEPPVQEDETIIKARALLRAGRTIEQVARETGVEIGALRLMKQMNQKD